MKIVNVVCAKGRTGFFFDDQRAIKKGAVKNSLNKKELQVCQSGRLVVFFCDIIYLQ